MPTVPSNRSPKSRSRKSSTKPVPVSGPRTLAIDIGGTGMKALVLDGNGRPLTERLRVKTPHPATPNAVLRELFALIEPAGAFDRVSVGFPGVVDEGVVWTAPNLHPRWEGFDLAEELAKRTGRPVRVLNDAGVHGHAVIAGRGVELLLTLGTGMGTALFVDGHYVPNLELAHHPLRHGKTYEDLVSDAALQHDGKKKWNKHLATVLDQVQPTFNPRHIYLGGGNARHITLKLPKNVTVVENLAGLMGGAALWRDADAPSRRGKGSGSALGRHGSPSARADE